MSDKVYNIHRYAIRIEDICQIPERQNSKSIDPRHINNKTCVPLKIILSNGHQRSMINQT